MKKILLLSAILTTVTTNVFAVVGDEPPQNECQKQFKVFVDIMNTDAMKGKTCLISDKEFVAAYSPVQEACKPVKPVKFSDIDENQMKSLVMQNVAMFCGYRIPKMNMDCSQQIKSVEDILVKDQIRVCPASDQSMLLINQVNEKCLLPNTKMQPIPGLPNPITGRTEPISMNNYNHALNLMGFLYRCREQEAHSTNDSSSYGYGWYK